MTGDEFKIAMAKLRLDRHSAAAFLSVSLRTMDYYANGDHIPEGTAKLLRLMVRKKIKPEDVK